MRNKFLKKYILSIFIISAFSILPATADDGTANPIDPRVLNPEEVIYQTPISDFAQNLNEENDDIYIDDRSVKKIDPYKMPMFKQMRLRMTNKYRQMTSKEKVKTQTPLISRLKFWDKSAETTDKNSEEKDLTTTAQESDLLNAIDKTANIETSDSVLLDGGVNEENVEKQLQLDAANINFDDETGDMIATGRPILFLPPQNTKIIADKMQYNDAGNILKAIGNVVVIKDGKETHSDYLEIDMNEELLTSSNIYADFPRISLKAEDGQQQDGLIILNHGSMYSDNSYVYRLMSRTAGSYISSEMLLDPNTENLFFGHPEDHKLNINMSYLEIDAGKNHDTIKAKDIQFTHNDKVFFKWPSLTMYTNKEHNYFEGNYPEFGSRRKMGAFIGPGFAFKGPFGSVMKVIPILNYRDGIGFGGMLKYVNTYNRTELGYGSSNDIFFLRGKQKLDDNLFLQYAYNSYTSEWFLGGRMPKYIAELVYDKSYTHNDFLGKNMDMTFRQRASFGFMKDDDKNYNGEKYNNATNMSTTRTRYMAEVNQTLYKYTNEENQFQANFGVRLQGSAALYGTGDTQFVARIGPYFRIQYKNWFQDINYFLTGYDDQTPVPHFDAYRYGKDSIRVTEALRITKYLTLGWTGYVNLSDDAPNGKTFQENAFILSIGPDDFKIILGYDTIRDRTYFGFNVAFDPKGTTVNYGKLVIKNPERLGKHAGEDDNEQKVAYTPAQNETETEQKSLVNFKKSNAKPKVLQYAQVIEIEDPDKERIY